MIPDPDFHPSRPLKDNWENLAQEIAADPPGSNLVSFGREFCLRVDYLRQLADISPYPKGGTSPSDGEPVILDIGTFL